MYDYQIEMPRIFDYYSVLGLFGLFLKYSVVSRIAYSISRIPHVKNKNINYQIMRKNQSVGFVHRGFRIFQFQVCMSTGRTNDKYLQQVFRHNKISDFRDYYIPTDWNY